MKKLISYVVVFVLGFGACALILNQMGYVPSSGGRSAVDGLTAHPMPPIGGKGGNPIVQAVAKVGPAVVNIDTVTERRVPGAFPGFFPQIVTGQGSGVIISKDGYVLTNNHVVAGARDIGVRLEDGRRFKARVVGRDGFTDLAVLKINGRNLPFAKLGDSDSLRVGDWAIAIGNPLGFGSSVTVGVISAKKRTDLPVGEGQQLKEAIQTDAAINRGNSGGALANINGEVVGINTAIASTEPGQGNIGIGFAIPINYARGTVKGLIAKGKIVRPYLGVIVETADAQTLFAAPRHPYSRALLSAIPVPRPRAKRSRILLTGELPSALNPPPGCRFHTRCPHVIDRCRVEPPRLLADTGSHLTACHRTAELPSPDAVVPSDGGFSPVLERLVAAFSGGTEGASVRGVDIVGAAPPAAV